MVIDMNEAQVRTLIQVRQLLAGTQAMEFQAASDDAGRDAWIEPVLRRLDKWTRPYSTVRELRANAKRRVYAKSPSGAGLLATK